MLLQLIGSRQVRKICSTGIIFLFGLFIFSPAAHARLIFTTEEDGTAASGWTVDQNDASTTTIDLNFGTATSAQIQYDTTTSKFVISHDLDVNSKQLLNARVHNNSGDPATCAAGLAGQIYYDTSSSTLKYCNGTSFVDSSNGSTTLADANIFVGNASNVATAVALSGDATIANTGALTIGTGAVTSAKILDGTIALADMAADSVDSSKIVDGSVSLADMNTDSVNSSKIVDESIVSADILDGTIALADMASSSVDSDNIVDATIATADMADNAITTAKIGTAGAGDANKVLTTDGSGDPQWEARTNFVSSTLTDTNIYVGNGSNVATGVAMSGDATIANTGALTIGTGAVTSAKILDGTVALADMAGDSVDSSKIVDGSVSLADMNSDSVNSAKIVDESITSADILDGTIALSDMASASVDSDNIVDGTIVFADIAAREATNVMAPEFSNFTLNADGSANKGTLLADYDSTNKRNYYQWSTRQSAIQDYDIVVQWAVPENFQAWSATVDPIQVDFKTNTTTNTDNKLDISMLDTAGTAATLGGNSALVSATADTWVNESAVTITGGTFTPGQYITLTFKMSATTGNPTTLGAINFNYTVK